MAGTYLLRALVVLLALFLAPVFLFAAGMANDNSSTAGLIASWVLLGLGGLAITGLLHWAFSVLGTDDRGTYKPPRIQWFVYVALLAVFGGIAYVFVSSLLGAIGH